MSKPVGQSPDESSVNPELKKMYDDLQISKKKGVWGHVVQKLGAAHEKIYYLGKEGLMSQPEHALLKLEGHLKSINKMYQEHEKELRILEKLKGGAEIFKEDARKESLKKAADEAIKEYNQEFNKKHENFAKQLDLMKAIFSNAKAKILDKEELFELNQGMVEPRTEMGQAVKNVEKELKIMMAAHKKEEARVKALKDEEKRLAEAKAAEKPKPVQRVKVSKKDEEKHLVDTKAAEKPKPVQKVKVSKADEKALSEMKESFSKELTRLQTQLKSLNDKKIKTQKPGLPHMSKLPSWGSNYEKLTQTINEIKKPETDFARLKELVSSGKQNLIQLHRAIQAVPPYIADLNTGLSKLEEMGY